MLSRVSIGSKTTGFTLIELLITIAIISILTVIASPPLRQFTLRNTLSTEAERFMGALALTRSEAINRGVNVSLIPFNTNWDDGYAIYEGTASSGQLIRQFSAASGGYDLVTSASRYTFNFRGMLVTTAQDLTICHPSVAVGKTISITQSGISNMQVKNDC